MIVAIQGTKNFNDYGIFLRGMGVALRSMPEDDTEFVVCSTGPTQLNSFAQEFLNVSERSLKARGIKVRFRKVPPKWMKENIKDFGYVLFFSKPKEPVSEIVDLAEAKDIEVGVYRY